MTTPILIQKKRSPLWVKCLLLSVAAHAAIGGYLYYNPMLLQSPLQSLFGITLADSKELPHETEVDFIDKNFLLEEVFSTVFISASNLQLPYDLNELPQGIALSPQEETIQSKEPQLEEPSSFTALIDKKVLSQETILKEIQEISPSPLFQALEKQAQSASQIQIDDPLIALETPFLEPIEGVTYEDVVHLNNLPQGAIAEREDGTLLLFDEKTIELGKTSDASANKVQMDSHALITSEKKPTLLIPKTPSHRTQINLSQVEHSAHDLKQYTFPTLSPTALWNEDFTVDISVTPHPERDSYIFALRLTPTKDLSSHKLKQNFYFILDRSSSSQKRRFDVFKRATLKALASIPPEDSFNIFILDKQITKFSPENLSASFKNRRAAEDFLETQDANLLFNNGNIYSSLKKILPSIPSNTEMHTAILLTDGQSGLNPKKKKEIFNKWINDNNERVTLYTAAVGRDNDLLSLDLLSTESGGRLLYSDTHASFPRKLAKLILDLKQPLAKEIDITVRPHQTRSRIELYPTAYSLPPLYANEPYTILGEIDQLASFDLILEGRHGEDWIKIKKKISFDRAHKAEPQLVKLWKKTQASICYAKFLEGGKASHLKDAKEILNQNQREIAFQ